MSETQLQEPVNEEVVSEEDAALLAEQEAYLNEDEPKAEAEPEPEPEKTETEAKPAETDKAANLQKALAESRFQARQTQRELKEMREALAALRQPANDRNQEPVIDPDQDPISAIKYLTAKVNAYEHQAAEQQRAQQEQEQQSQAINQLQTYMSESEQVATAEFPDYPDAMKHLVGSRAAELKALGYPEDQLNGIITNEYYGLIGQAMQNGQNPAYLVYQQARARGFTGPVQAEPNEATPGAAQQQLDAIRKGQETPKTTRGGGGSSNSGSITEEMLMNAKGAEFDKLWAQFEKQNAS
jgi:DNA polymerase III gamma/tau subunit